MTPPTSRVADVDDTGTAGSGAMYFHRSEDFGAEVAGAGFTDGWGSLVVPARHERDVIDAAVHCPGECIHLEADAQSAPAEGSSDIDDADIVDGSI